MTDNLEVSEQEVVTAAGEIIRKHDRVTLVTAIGHIKAGRTGTVLSVADGYVRASFARTQPLVTAPVSCFALARPERMLGQVRLELEQTARRLESLGAPGRMHALLLRQLVAGADSPAPGTAPYASYIYRG